MKEQKIQIDDVNINFIRNGTGDHPVLLLPGVLGAGWLIFAPQIEDLNTEKLTIVAWDPPGYGKSRPPDRTYPDNYYQRDAMWAHSLMKTLGYSKFSLVGCSDGGTTALLLAATYPESIRKMIVVATRSYIHPDEINTQEDAADIDNFPEDLRELLVEIYGVDYIKQTLSKWFDAALRFYNKQDGDLCKQALPKINCPTLILHGSNDPLLVPDQALDLKQNIINSTIYIYENDTPNDISIHPEAFNKVITEFLLEK
ncbi:valacyclovir hydrolase [Ooceraea biroi]|uniref:Valacyclovir hydrolase n=1 Tax=Ooceraea biroi TaxID=2015173 RepID=A0A026X473_OOCBI|nr:valacyclovir hydrolase [Ooceraea biroi]EZA62903.1 Valacyclovir hydrolase [Ooceraea biroi]